METIAFLNKKGGVGKTSSVFHLSAALAKLNRRVLLVDTDPQGSLTQGFWGPEGLAALPPEQTVAAVLGDVAAPPLDALVRPTGLAGVDILPGSELLELANEIPRRDWREYQSGFRDSLAEATGYDLALIDCPPNLNLCSWAALVAADRLVVPLQAEEFGGQGLGPVQRAVAAVQAGPNPMLRLAGYLLTMFDKRLAVHQVYADLLRERYQADVFEHVVPRAKDFPESVMMRKPLALYKPRGAAAKAVDAVAAELLQRCGLLATVERGAA